MIQAEIIQGKLIELKKFIAQKISKPKAEEVKTEK